MLREAFHVTYAQGYNLICLIDCLINCGFKNVFFLRCDIIIIQTFKHKSNQRVHTRLCQTKARTGLLEDGMSEEEAYLAVEPPLTMLDDDSDPTDHEAIENPFILKECYVLLRRMPLVELK